MVRIRIHILLRLYINILLCKAALLRIRIRKNDTLKILLDPDIKTIVVSILLINLKYSLKSYGIKKDPKIGAAAYSIVTR